MKKTRQLHYSLRSYFVVLFIGILAVTCLLGLLLLAFLKELVGIKAGLVFWIALYTFFIMCMGGLMMWQGSIHLTKPISDLNEAVKRVSSGDFSVKISRKAYPKDQGLYHNEIDELSQNFNQMAEDLQTIAQLRQDFISNVSHELKTPVASLAGISELLLEDQLSNEEEADLLDIMQAETMRLSRLCDDILNLSRLDKQENISPSPVRIDEQLRQAVILLTEKWKDKAISLDYNSQSLTLLTEADLTMRVWLNILDNAIKYSLNKSA
ncbi:sensor histidine kinase [Streptococcus didelphis]|uniref:sensor histidine kinase n=1 Tax=Streptococcus didelphis TaxID=102886 RepID=UPI0027D325CC|nr:HAMP domain-containing sensor histidine kinase [Streptococcus didelphis]